jgi:branched-chain amino acid aminotransferase
MTSDTNEGYVYLDGELVPRAEASVSAFDRGLLYGDGVFETMRAYEGHNGGGVIFRLEDHLRRLSESARALRIELPAPVEHIADTARIVLVANRLPNAYMRITLTRGPHEGALSLDSAQPSTLLIDCRPLHAYPDDWYAGGIKLITSESRRSRSAIAPRHKCLSYIENLLILDSVRAAGAQEAVVLTDDGYVCEGAMSNIFRAADGGVFTPSAEANLLCGITRAVVIEICNRLGLRLEEGLFEADALTGADEVFVTNSIMEIMPVAEIDGIRIATCPGDLTCRLMQEYAAEVRRYLSSA